MSSRCPRIGQSRNGTAGGGLPMRAGSPDAQRSTARLRGLKTALAVCILIVGALSPRSYDAFAQIQQKDTAVSTRAGGAVIDNEQAEQQAEEQRSKIAEKLSPNHSFALVIGIDAFDDSAAWHYLPGVLKEIQEVQAAFKAQGFQIDINSNLIEGGGEAPHLEPLNASQLNRRIGEFLKRNGREADNRLVIYVATHGYAGQKPGGNPEEKYGYLVTKDSPNPYKQSLEGRAYSVTRLANDLLQVEAQHIYLFFNACFSGAMVPKIQSRGETEQIESDVRRLDANVVDWAQNLLAHNARLILTAGSDDQTVPDANNPFSKAVVEGLAGAAQNDEGLILGTTLASYVRNRVALESRLAWHPNDPIFAFMPKITPPSKPRGDLKLKRPLTTIEYAQKGDFVFLSPRGPRRSAPEGQELAALLQKLPVTQSLDCPDCPIMVKIPGSQKIPAFALAQTETTFLQWDACYRDFHCQTWVDDHGLGRGDRPVSGITWQDALEFISWLDAKNADRAKKTERDAKRTGKPQCEKYRLPEPAEWAFAARGNTATRYPWGDRIAPDRANCWNCGSAWDGVGPAPVKRFSPNAFGLYDMIGNVWEWGESSDNQCSFADMGRDGRCPKDGSVMGGAFSTKLEGISFDVMGSIPRTSNIKQSS